jgi:hypothetical protein
MVPSIVNNVYEETYLKTAETLVKILPDIPTIKQIIYTGSYSVSNACRRMNAVS